MVKWIFYHANVVFNYKIINLKKVINLEIITGQVIKSKKVPNLMLEIVFVDNLTEECICTELFSHDAKQFKVKFDDIEG